MTYDPYETEREARQRAEELIERCDLPDGWADRVRGPLTTLAKRNREQADRLATAIKELHEAFVARGELIAKMAGGDEADREEQQGHREGTSP